VKQGKRKACHHRKPYLNLEAELGEENVGINIKKED
jgi:hypothetical protein